MDFLTGFDFNILNLPYKISLIDIVEILIIWFLMYRIMNWIKRTRAWALLKGILVMLLFILIAAIFRMNTILWIVQNSAPVAITVGAIVFQPEIRKALEQLGEKKFFTSIFPFESKDDQYQFSDKALSEIVKASFEMGKVKTGALIVIENNILLTEYEKTGIEIDSMVSSQLLINIFEHNTPLHDGAVIISGDRIKAATCYLPLSDSMLLSKELGTRHRAAVGISEVSDSITIVVSEETGKVSVASKGTLTRDVTPEVLSMKLALAQNKMADQKRFKRKKGKQKDESKDQT
ncbi:MAG TPA: TIGR00159 family protein [Candidatus Merdenecus merdavium]|nr:TIGR00159 family protein [Candidatus Merdenecus merdavium]